MSCGEPHETDCREVLAEVYLYLDLECADERRELIRHHLDECGALPARVRHRAGGQGAGGPLLRQRDRAGRAARAAAGAQLTELVVFETTESRELAD